MREIKFRAWDKEKQFMFVPTQIELSQGENFTKWDKWKPMAWRDEISDEGCGGIGRVLGDECELMQYTGLKDVNGKDIYEGDIVKNKDYEGDIISVVTFDRGVFCLEDEEILPYIQYPLHEWNENCEIVGNVYQNPELLGDIN